MADTESQVIWSIGDASLDPHQFSDRWFSDDATRVPEFHVGSDDPATQWPRLHPGPLNASTGFAPLPITAIFHADPPLTTATDLALAAEVFASHGPCPQLLVEVNGHRGIFFLTPERHSRADSAGRPSPISGAVSLRARLPQGVLHAGENRLVITTMCMDEVDPAELVPQRLPRLGTWFGSAITWRRLALIREPDMADCDIELRPLPLFIRAPHGQSELIDIRIRPGGEISDGKAEVALGGERYEVELRADGRRFGDLWARFAVPDGQRAEAAVVRVHLNGTVTERSFPFRPCRKWTLHLLPHVHLDVGYTDLPAKVIELHSRNLERAADILRKVPDFRFTIDGSHTLGEFLRTRDGAAADEVLAALRDGQLGVNAFSLLFLSGLLSLEEMIRSAHEALFLNEEKGIRVDHAHLTDVPSYSWALPPILRALGLDAFIGIANHTRGANQDSDELHLASPLRWQGPDGQEVLAFLADCYTQLRFLAADPPTIAGLADSLTRHLSRYEREDYLPCDLPIVGTHADNEDLADGYSYLVERWSARYAYPQLRFSTFGDYIDAVRPFRDHLPVIRGDGGSYWEDGAGTQAAVVATYRGAQALLPAADSLSALVCSAYPGLRPDRAGLDQAWRHLAFGAEHTWGATHATERPHSQSAADITDWKVAQIRSAWRAAADEALRGLSQLAELAGARGPALITYNPAPRTRDLTVEHELPVSVRPVAADGTPIPSEVLEAPRDGYARARFTVRAVQPFGYQVTRLIKAAERAAPAPWQKEPFAATRRHAVHVDPDTARIVSLVHRSSGRELLDTSEYGLGEVIYVSGGGDRTGRGIGDQATSLNEYDPALPPPQLTIQRCHMEYSGFRMVPDGCRLHFEGVGPTLPRISADLRLFDDTDRVELSVHLHKKAELAKEGVYIAFPFAVPDPAFRYDRQIGWVDPAHDHLTGACNEWFAVQHGAAMTGSAGGVIWASPDAPLVTLDVVRGTWARQCRPQSGTLLSWVMNNYWWTNTPASQEGPLTLRYAFWPVDEWDEANASVLARDFRTPAPSAEVTHLDRTMGVDPVLPTTAGQLLKADVPSNIDARIYSSVKWTGGIVARLQEVGGGKAHATITHPHSLHGTAWLADGAERLSVAAPVNELGQVQVGLGPYQVRTLLLLPGQAEQKGKE